MKPFSESCVQNREPILAVLKPLLADSQAVLEIGSGTGQHAVYFAPELPHLRWQTSDVAEHLPGIRQWLAEAALPNLPEPLQLDVLQPHWPDVNVDAVFTANSLHIMNWAMVQACFAGVGELLQPGGRFIAYGPFNYGGQYTSPSNARFDQWLARQGRGSAIRHFEDLQQLAQAAGLQLYEDFAMPVNNRILCWEKQ
ncbi:MAG: DUF938 domain-containing protein [Thiolinea sp.]